MQEAQPIEWMFGNIKMKTINEKCDRCGELISGIWGEEGTLGFYNLINTQWSKYSKSKKEKIICDKCMWEDEKYLKDYPHMRK